MANFTLFRRWRTGILARVQAETPARAIELIVEARGSLAYADLNGLDAPRCFLPSADLRGAALEGASLSGSYFGRADLRSASLVGADLRSSTLIEADLRGADLRRADLRRADLRGADFTGADLRDACATGAQLDGARLDWRGSAFALELLRRQAWNQPGAHGLIAEIALTPDVRPYAWLAAAARRPDLIGWVISVVRPAIQPGDGASELLGRLAADAVEVESPPCDPTSGTTSDNFYWTRSVHARGALRRKSI
ncbi:pentapeptide repeat-containing protein [Paludisphaera sp.]|uniref:pentapeptide repeat-containing protein n=1 Tax=Paludisphaera sp. TaxID=2017432 RepID=UPI00301C132F